MRPETSATANTAEGAPRAIDNVKEKPAISNVNYSTGNVQFFCLIPNPNPFRHPLCPCTSQLPVPERPDHIKMIFRLSQHSSTLQYLYQNHKFNHESAIIPLKIRRTHTTVMSKPPVKPPLEDMRHHVLQGIKEANALFIQALRFRGSS